MPSCKNFASLGLQTNEEMKEGEKHPLGPKCSKERLASYFCFDSLTSSHVNAES